MAKISIPHNIEIGKRSITLLFLCSVHRSVIIGYGILCFFICGCSLVFFVRLYEKNLQNIYISKNIIDLYIKSVVK